MTTSLLERKGFIPYKNMVPSKVPDFVPVIIGNNDPVAAVIPDCRRILGYVPKQNVV